MKVFVNKKETILEENCTIEQMLKQTMNSTDGFAVAVGMKVIKKALWAETQLREGDNVTIIKATCGG
jgi:sulfur carrier protein